MTGQTNKITTGYTTVNINTLLTYYTFCSGTMASSAYMTVVCWANSSTKQSISDIISTADQWQVTECSTVLTPKNTIDFTERIRYSQIQRRCTAQLQFTRAAL